MKRLWTLHSVPILGLMSVLVTHHAEGVNEKVEAVKEWLDDRDITVSTQDASSLINGKYSSGETLWAYRGSEGIKITTMPSKR